jgi:acetyltransferase-like isoleucine patch superfamily enzyme
MKKVLFFLAVDLIWIIGFLLVLGISTIPMLFLGKAVYNSFGINILFVISPILIFLWINLYILSVGLIHKLFVPKLKEGRFRILSGQWIKWRLNWILYSYVFLFFNRYMLFNKFIKTPFLWLMGAKVHYTTYFGETADLQDVNNLLSFGKNTLIGSEVIMATHLIISEKHIIFRQTSIGDGSVIGARCCLAPGTRIGNNVILGFNVSVSLNVIIEDGTSIEGACTLHANSKIGKNCKIGFAAVIEQGSVVQDNTVIPAYSVWGKKGIKEQNSELMSV